MRDHASFSFVAGCSLHSGCFLRHSFLPPPFRETASLQEDEEEDGPGSRVAIPAQESKEEDVRRGWVEIEGQASAVDAREEAHRCHKTKRTLW